MGCAASSRWFQNQCALAVPPSTLLTNGKGWVPPPEFATARGDDPLGVYRDLRDRIDLPCEKNKFDSGGAFAIDFINRGSSRFSPQSDALKKLHIKAMENRKASAG